jgi:thiosulfate dehydrogenase
MKFIFGIVIGAILVPVVLVIYLASGFAPTAATDKPFPFETWLANTALRARMQKEPASHDLSTFTTADLVAAAGIYKKDCAVCHGLPDEPDASIGRGMFPPAPQFMAPPPPGRGFGGPPPAGRGPGRNGPPRGSGDYWRIKNGIRLTGMPSFEQSLSDDQIWQLVALLQSRRNFPPEVTAALQPDSAATTSPLPLPALGK